MGNWYYPRSRFSIGVWMVEQYARLFLLCSSLQSCSKVRTRLGAPRGCLLVILRAPWFRSCTVFVILKTFLISVSSSNLLYGGKQSCLALFRADFRVLFSLSIRGFLRCFRIPLDRTIVIHHDANKELGHVELTFGGQLEYTSSSLPSPLSYFISGMIGIFVDSLKWQERRISRVSVLELGILSGNRCVIFDWWLYLFFIRFKLDTFPLGSGLTIIMVTGISWPSFLQRSVKWFANSLFPYSFLSQTLSFVSSHF